MRKTCGIALTALCSALLLSGALLAQQLNSMKLLARKTGWAWSGNHLYWTTDNGAQWKDIAPPMPKDEWLGGVFFLDTSTGWVVLARPGKNDDDEPQLRVAFTHDAGASWSNSKPVELGQQKGVQAGGNLYFLDALRGWMQVGIGGGMHHGGRLMATQDGGKTWRYTPGNPRGVGDFCFFNDKDGIFTGEEGVGAYDVAYVTHDGSKTWQELSLKAPAQAAPADYPAYGKPVCQAGKHGFLPVAYTPTDYPNHETLSTALVLFATADGGETWNVDRVLLKLPDISHAERVPSALADASLIGATNAGRKARLAVVAPGGETRNVTTEAFRSVGDLSFVSASEGWVQAESLFSTTDGGTSWANISPGRDTRSGVPRTVLPRLTLPPIFAQVLDPQSQSTMFSFASVVM